jgi:hypothetical protein
MTKKRLSLNFSRLVTEAAFVIVVLLQVFCLVVSVAAFYKIDALIVSLKISHAAIPSVILLLVSSFLPLVIAGLLVTVLKTSTTPARFTHLLAALVTFYYLLSALFLCYRAETGLAFDWPIIRYHLRDAIETAMVLTEQYRMLMGVLLLVVVLHYWGLVALLRRHGDFSRLTGQNLSERSSTRSAMVAMIVLAATHLYADNSLFNLIRESRETKSEAKTLYARYYEDSVSRLKSRPVLIAEGATNENLFLIHLESVNADLVNKSITPRLLQIAKERGVLFPRIQAPSIFTILAQESILCSVLPALERNLAESEHVRGELVCLPRILKEFGFKTLYFHSLPNIHFANTDTS